MKVTIGYKTWDTNGWKLGEDLGQRTLICPDCECTIKLKYYDQACGTKATRFCPYCGSRRQESDKSGKTSYAINEMLGRRSV